MLAAIFTHTGFRILVGGRYFKRGAGLTLGR